MAPERPASALMTKPVPSLSNSTIPMIIITQQSGGTNKAEIRTEKNRGFKILYKASSTESEEGAARAVVRKWFTEAAAKTVTRIPNEQIAEHVPSNPNRRRCNPVAVWTFNPHAR
jgi:hypothetical protein